ncbi:hypothetical protein HYY74_04620 [Candidatus Woesearchaeota archaeon]|nr:hypothetical protein [Candidatus Woesearchaeota archaeon]
MTSEIPQYGLRVYALFYTKHGSREPFAQSELDWIVGQSMKKKIFALLLKSGWIVKESRNSYKCVEPGKVMKGLLEFKVPGIMKEASKPYAFTNLSAVEIWSDYSYVQRGNERSPYFIKILKKDVRYWKAFFNKWNIPNYVGRGSTVGEFVILFPVKGFHSEKKGSLMVEPLAETMKTARENEMYSYAYDYMKDEYGSCAA